MEKVRGGDALERGWGLIAFRHHGELSPALRGWHHSQVWRSFPSPAVSACRGPEPGPLRGLRGHAGCSSECRDGREGGDLPGVPPRQTPWRSHWKMITMGPLAKNDGRPLERSKWVCPNLLHPGESWLTGLWGEEQDWRSRTAVRR